jgi:hypothetical protein
METDIFKTERINELLYRLVCEPELETQMEAYRELLKMGLAPETIEELAKEIDCQDLLDSLDDNLLGC